MSGFKGKFIGNCFYYHVSALENISALDTRFIKAYERLKETAEDKDFTKVYATIEAGIQAMSIIKYDLTTKMISFLEVDNFDEWLNPILLSSLSVSIENPLNIVTANYRSRANKQIYHKKEDFVLPDYIGFDQNLSREWTKFYESSEIPELTNKSKIGYINYWREGLKKLEEQQPEKIKKFKSYYQNIFDI